MGWILALGGVGIVLGLSTYGYRIMRLLGTKMCKITPSRGFAIEIGSALIIALGSNFGCALRGGGRNPSPISAPSEHPRAPTQPRRAAGSPCRPHTPKSAPPLAWELPRTGARA